MDITVHCIDDSLNHTYICTALVDLMCKGVVSLWESTSYNGVSPT